MTLPPGPFAQIPTLQGPDSPLYLIPFDKKGRCEGPQTLEHLVAMVGTSAFSDVHIFSHGWNNVFKEALDLYREFFNEYFVLRSSTGIANAGYSPLLVGILWPSTVLVSEGDEGPRFAGDRDAAFAEDQLTIRELASELADEHVTRFYELANLGRPLTQDEALELANILLPVLSRDDASGEDIPQQVSAEKLVKAWEKTSLSRPARTGEAGDSGAPGRLPDEEDGRIAVELAPAAMVDFLNPREIVRKASVFMMKDRAGTVGASGVGGMLQRLLAIPGPRVHLMGHSFGAKVVLSALTVPSHPRNVESVLLLQPAVNHLCFAQNVEGRPGGYRPALERVNRPIFSTFSAQDSALAKFFHLALRRDGDLGEQQIAGVPSKFAALGGFGPAGLSSGESSTIEILAPPTPYPPVQASVKIRALDGSSNKITGHGDVRNPFSEWALVNLTL